MWRSGPRQVIWPNGVVFQRSYRCDRGQDRAEIWRASAKSLAVSPPAEWVLRVSVTLFHEMATSG